MSSDGSVLILGDSLCYYGPKGGLAADDPRIWPNLVAREFGWDSEIVARIGWTCRDAYWALMQDPRAWAAVPKAKAVILATGGMDSLPSPLPTALRELIRYIRPPGVRRSVRDAYSWLQPRLAHLGWPQALPAEVSVSYLEQIRSSLATLRPDLPVIATLPSVHEAPSYGYVHNGRARAALLTTEWANENRLPIVDLSVAVAGHVGTPEANPDGIHWGWQGHTNVARLMSEALRSTGRVPA